MWSITYSPQWQLQPTKKGWNHFGEKISGEFSPDIIHIHGTEFPHGLACMRACPSLNYIVSIQGMVGVYSRYYYANINHLDILKHITFRDVVRFVTIFQRKKNFEKRGKFENEYLHKTHYVIGRTSWYFAHVKSINPNVDYYFDSDL